MRPDVAFPNLKKRGILADIDYTDPGVIPRIFRQSFSGKSSGQISARRRPSWKGRQGFSDFSPPYPWEQGQNHSGGEGATGLRASKALAEGDRNFG